MRIALLALLLLPATAFADGWLSMRGAYYKERSTRVQQPMIDAELETSPTGLLRAHVLVDHITSASPAAGSPQEFSETRYEAGASYTKTLDDLRLGGGGRFSTEEDYDSLFAHGKAELDLAQKNTLVAVNVALGHDSITNGIAVAQGSIGTPRISETLDTYLVSATVLQNLTPQLVGVVTADAIFLDGYQANVYRQVTGGAAPVPERVPDFRVRTALFASLRGHVCPTGTTLYAGYRFYVDDWGIVAHTPEVRVIQEVVDDVDLRLRFRYHTQSAADFYDDVYTAARIRDDAYVTEDEKLAAMHSELFGAQLSVAFKRFGVTGRWGEARVDAVVEYVQQSTSFGDAIIGEVGLRVPLSY